MISSKVHTNKKIFNLNNWGWINRWEAADCFSFNKPLGLLQQKLVEVFKFKLITLGKNCHYEELIQDWIWGNKWGYEIRDSTKYYWTKSY